MCVYVAAAAIRLKVVVLAPFVISHFRLSENICRFGVFLCACTLALYYCISLKAALLLDLKLATADGYFGLQPICNYGVRIFKIKF